MPPYVEGLEMPSTLRHARHLEMGRREPLGDLLVNTTAQIYYLLFDLSSFPTNVRRTPVQNLHWKRNGARGNFPLTP